MIVIALLIGSSYCFVDIFVFGVQSMNYKSVEMTVGEIPTDRGTQFAPKRESMA